MSEAEVSVCHVGGSSLCVMSEAEVCVSCRRLKSLCVMSEVQVCVMSWRGLNHFMVGTANRMSRKPAMCEKFMTEKFGMTGTLSRDDITVT